MWLREQLERTGEASIGRLLGVNKKTVTAARVRLGIPAATVGSRRGVVTGRRSSDPAVNTTLARIVTRFEHDAAPPTWDTVLTHLAAADRARRSHDRTSEQNSAIALAAAAARVADHLEGL